MHVYVSAMLINLPCPILLICDKICDIKSTLSNCWTVFENKVVCLLRMLIQKKNNSMNVKHGREQRW